MRAGLIALAAAMGWPAHARAASGLVPDQVFVQAGLAEDASTLVGGLTWQHP